MSIMYIRDATGNLVPVKTIQGATGPRGPQGHTGDNGATFIPSVSEDGVLSWTNDKGLTNPPSVDIAAFSGSSAEKDWELFKTVTLEEEVGSIEITTDDSGNAFDYKEIIIRGAIMHSIANASKECILHINDGRCASAIKYPQNTDRPMYLHAVCGWDYCRVFYIPALTHGNPAMTNYQMAGMVADKNALQNSIRKIKLTAASDAPFSTSTSFSIWGR